jgi:hypothetical protein
MERLCSELTERYETMPEFIAEHVPNGLDDFLRGYLETAEWLIDETVDRAKIRGFTKAAIAKAKADCDDFIRAYSDQLSTYTEESGRGDDSAGMDFFLSRNGHGVGFFDRGSAPVFDELQDAARGYGTCDVDVYRGWISLVRVHKGVFFSGVARVSALSVDGRRAHFAHW